MQYEMKKVDTALFETTKTEWERQAGCLGDIGLLIQSDIGRVFQWVKSNNLHNYALVREGCAYASAIIEITHALPNSETPYLKVLDIKLEPNLNLEIQDQEDESVLKQIFDVQMYALIYSITLIFSELPSTKLKIYGRTDLMVGMFNGVISAGKIDDTLSKLGLTIRRESKWLVIDRAESSDE